MELHELTPVARMSRDIAQAAKTLTDTEARYLVDAYYIMQEDRKRTNNQVRALGDTAEPNSVLAYLADQATVLEKQIQRALDKYTEGHPMGSWMREVRGIGPVLSAGLLSHIDITKAPTAGHIWRYAGLDPTSKWEKGCKRPWNAQLKTLCWKIGQSFMKLSNDDDCLYGKLYRQRKEYEQARNGTEAVAAAVAVGLARVGKTTDAHKHLSEGKLPPAQIDARARRWAVKMFLSHLHAAWYQQHYGVPAPKPFAIAILGHAHEVMSGH
jgi:hypothetical protein